MAATAKDTCHRCGASVNVLGRDSMGFLHPGRACEDIQKRRQQRIYADLLAASQAALVQLQLIAAINSSRAIRKREIEHSGILRDLSAAIAAAGGKKLKE